MVQRTYTLDEAQKVLEIEKEFLIIIIIRELPSFCWQKSHHLTQSEIDSFKEKLSTGEYDELKAKFESDEHNEFKAQLREALGLLRDFLR